MIVIKEITKARAIRWLAAMSIKGIGIIIILFLVWLLLLSGDRDELFSTFAVAAELIVGWVIIIVPFAIDIAEAVSLPNIASLVVKAAWLVTGRTCKKYYADNTRNDICS